MDSKEGPVVDIRSIIAGHRPKIRSSEPKHSSSGEEATFSKIPDLFFDEVLVSYRLSRIEILVLMYIYRRVWCRPNLYKEFGISPLLGHTDMAKRLNLNMEEVYHSLRKLEEFQFITTIRSGQYFVRKFFTRENDERFGQNYDDFEI